MQLYYMWPISNTTVEVRKGYETQFNMLQTMVCNLIAVGHKEDILKVSKGSKEGT
jgi:hypothetical protein